MKLWILRPVETQLKFDPWLPWYDKSFGFVIRAKTEIEARNIAHDNGGDENYMRYQDNDIKPWLDSNYSTCLELTKKGETGLIMLDFHSA